MTAATRHQECEGTLRAAWPLPGTRGHTSKTRSSMSGTLTILMVKMACERDEWALASVSLCVRLCCARANSRTASCTITRHCHSAALRPSVAAAWQKNAPAAVHAPRAS